MADWLLPPVSFDYTVARMLKMTVAEVRSTMPATELVWWLMLLHREAENARR